MSHAAIWVRLARPSLVRMCCTWVSAVRSEMCMSAAICLFVSPAADVPGDFVLAPRQRARGIVASEARSRVGVTSQWRHAEARGSGRDGGEQSVRLLAIAGPAASGQHFRELNRASAANGGDPAVSHAARRAGALVPRRRAARQPRGDPERHADRPQIRNAPAPLAMNRSANGRAGLRLPDVVSQADAEPSSIAIPYPASSADTGIPRRRSRRSTGRARSKSPRRPSTGPARC